MGFREFIALGVSAGIGSAVGVGLSMVVCHLTGSPRNSTVQNKCTGLCIFLAVFLGYYFMGFRPQ